jgi:hypothetical protein
MKTVSLKLLNAYSPIQAHKRGGGLKGHLSELPGLGGEPNMLLFNLKSIISKKAS